MAFGRKLCKAFAAVAIFGAAMTAGAPAAQAYTPVSTVHISTTAATSAAAAAAAAANARHNREAANDVITNPSDKAIQHLKDRGLVDWTLTPYIRDAVNEMHIKPGTKPDNISEAQRDQFYRIIKEKRLVAEMSANDAAGARAKGLDESLAKYFDASKAELGFSGPVTLAQAQSIQHSVEAKHWENDTKPALKVAGGIAGGVAVVGGLAYALNRRKYSYY